MSPSLICLQVHKFNLKKSAWQGSLASQAPPGSLQPRQTPFTTLVQAGPGFSLFHLHWLQACPDRLVQVIEQRHSGLRDDTTLIVLDLLPEGKQFREVCADATRGSGGCLGCLTR